MCVGLIRRETYSRRDRDGGSGNDRRAENIPAIRGAAPEVREGQRVIARIGQGRAKREKIRALGGGGRRVREDGVSVEKEIRPSGFSDD